LGDDLNKAINERALPLEEQDLKLIFNAIESGRCLAFLGAGACTAFRRPSGEEEPGLPAGTIFFGEKDLVLHKMHGSIDEPNSLVITQSDYIRYLANLHDLGSNSEKLVEN